jgi:Cytochrome c554 and c-prime
MRKNKRIRHISSWASALFGVFVLVLATGCSGDNAEPTLTVEELMKPESCMECHPKHFKEWSGSMHAYAGNDPVFIAMNKKGQQETNGALGDFCVKCHAPMALALGLTKDGLNIAEVPQWAKGVTCYFCHNIKSVEGTHNNPLQLYMDGVMRAGISNPVSNKAHDSGYEKLIDSDDQSSSATCGSCHDIITQRGVHLERTFTEWQSTIFADPKPRQHLSCGQCHMIANDDVVASGEGLNVPLRPLGRSEHTFAAVDTALIDWPQKAEQRAAIDRDLKAVVAAKLCVLPTNGGEITLRLDNIGAGHSFPSGAAHDRRVWAELIAYNAANEVIFQTGVVPVDKDPEQIGDPNLFAMQDIILKADGTPAKFFWEVATVDPKLLLKPAVTLDVNNPAYDHATVKTYPVGALQGDIERVTAVVKMRALPLALFDALTPFGLSPDLKAQMPTLELSATKLVWTRASAVSLCVD